MGYDIRTGAVSTSSSCLYVTYGSMVDPPSHPIYPQPSTASPSNGTDTLGYDYTLVRNTGTELPPGYNQAAFTSWYSASFSDQGAVVQCTANNSYTAPLPTTTSSTVPHFAPLMRNGTNPQNGTYTACVTQNLTSSCSAVYQSPVPPRGSESVGQPPEATVTNTFGSSALTHTSVQFLTATSTSHVPTLFAPSIPPAESINTPIVSPPPLGSEPTSYSPPPEQRTSNNPPPEQQTSYNPPPGQPTSHNAHSEQSTGHEPPSGQPMGPQTQHGANQATSVNPPQPGQSNPPACDNASGCGEQRHSTTFVVTPQQNTHVVQEPVTTVLTASQGQIIALPTTRVSAVVSGSRTLTTSIVGSFTSTAAGGEQYTLTSDRPVTITSPNEPHVIQVPKTGVISATSGQVVVLPTTVSSTIVSGSRTITTTFVSSYSSTATADEQITYTTNTPSTITGPIGTYVADIPTSTVVTATSGEVFTIGTSILTTITSGSSTYVTSIPTSTVITATSNGELVTITTETQSTMTLAAGTYTTDVPGAPSSTGPGSGASARPGDSAGTASGRLQVNMLLYSLALTAVSWLV